MFSWAHVYIEKYVDGHWKLAEPTWVDVIAGTVEEIEMPEGFNHDFTDHDIFKNMIYGKIQDVGMEESFFFTDGPRDIPVDASETIKKISTHPYFDIYFGWTWFSVEELLNFDWEKEVHRYIYIHKSTLNTLPKSISCAELKKMETQEIYFISGQLDPGSHEDYEKITCTLPLAEYIGREILQSFFDALLQYGDKDKIRLICHLAG